MCNILFPGEADAVTLANAGFATSKFPICGFKFADEFDCGRAWWFTSMSQKPHILSQYQSSLELRRNQNGETDSGLDGKIIRIFCVTVTLLPPSLPPS